jgi:Tfp pilus assembly protein PilO
MNPLSKIISRFSNLNKRQKLVLGIGILVGFLFLYYLLLYAPLGRTLETKKGDLKRKKDDLARQQRLIENTPKREKQKEDYGKALAELKKGFLLEEQIPEFLKELGEITRQFQFDSSPPNPQRMLDQEGYKEQNIRIDSIKSDYHTLAGFLNTLENLPTLITVNNVQVSPDYEVSSRGVGTGEFPLENVGEGPPPTASARIATGKLSSSLTLSVYILLPEENEK